MKILEFYFNPKTKGDRFFDTLIEEPKQSSLGNLYVIGELTNALPQQAKFLTRTSTAIKEAFYEVKGKSALESAVKAVNASLKKELADGNVSWLGNLNLAALNIKVDRSGKQSLTFAKTGNIKVFVIRNSKVTDMDKDIKKSGVETTGAKIFGNIVAGQVSPGDKIIVITKDLYDTFLKEKIFGDFTFIEKEKQFQQLFKSKEKELSKTSGVLFSIQIEEITLKKIAGKKKERGSLFPAISLPIIVFPKLPFQPKLLLFAGLLIILAIGAIAFKGDREELVKEAVRASERVSSLQIEAENAQTRELENAFLQEAWKEASKQTKIGKARRGEFTSLIEGIEERLYELNNIEKVLDPESIMSVKVSEIGFVPKKMLLTPDNNLFLYNSFQSTLYKFNLDSDTKEKIQAQRNLKLGTVIGNSLLFFAEPGVLTSLDSENSWQEIPLRVPYPNVAFDSFVGFESSLYFFDSKAKEIVKFQRPDFTQGFLLGTLWLESKTTQKPGACAKCSSIAIDSNIWVLQNGKEIQRYFGGVYKETIEPLIFPFLKDAIKIYTTATLPNIYILDPSNERLIVITKFGDILKQYTSSKFSSAVDFVVSNNRKSVYILSDTDIYKVSIGSLGI